MIEGLLESDPATVGSYELLGRFDTGGMGQVYLAKSPERRLVAIKLIRADLAGDRGFRSRFAREVARARKVSGMYTAALLDADTTAVRPWMATAYVPGPSLKEAVDDTGPLPVNRVFALAAGLAQALSAIHRANVVHLDLKPSNILLAPDGPRVIDFGISRALWRFTSTGVEPRVMGSPGFMSPELAQASLDVTPSADVFSLGTVLAFAAAGQGPFGEGPTAALVYRVVHEEPDLTRVPAALRPLIERCLIKDPARRPTPAELLGMLPPEADPLTEDWLPTPVADPFDRASPTLAAPAPVPVSVPVSPPAEPPQPSATPEPGPGSAESLPATADSGAASGSEVLEPAETHDAAATVPEPAFAGVQGPGATDSDATVAGAATGAPSTPNVLFPTEVLPGPPDEPAPAVEMPGEDGSSSIRPRRRRLPFVVVPVAAVAAVAVTAVLALRLLPGGAPRSTPGLALSRSPSQSQSSPAPTRTTANTTHPATTTKSSPNNHGKPSSQRPTHSATPTAGSSPANTAGVNPPTSPPTHTTSPPPTTPIPKKTTTTNPPSGPQQITGYSNATPHGCPTADSATGGTQVRYTVRNNSGAPIYVLYLTSNGSSGPTRTVPAGQPYSDDVRIGQAWMIQNSFGGCMNTFTIDGSGTITVG